MPLRQRLLLLFASFIFAGTHLGANVLFASEDKPKQAENTKVPRKDRYGDPLPDGALARFGAINWRWSFNKAAFRADGREFYTWTQFGLLRVHDVATGKIIRGFRLPVPDHSGVQFSANGHFLILGVERREGSVGARALTIWETTTGKFHRRIDAPTGECFYPWSATMHDGRTVVTRDWDTGAVRLWNIEKRTCRVLRKTAPDVVRFVVSPDGKRLFVQLLDSVECWSMADGKKLWGRADGADDISVAPDGALRLLYESPARDWQVEVLDPANGKKKLVQRLPDILNGSAYWRADGRSVILPHHKGNVASIWDLEAGKELARLSGVHATFALSPDGKSLLGTNEGLLQRWDLSTMKPLYTRSADASSAALAIHQVACSPDGKVLATVDQDAQSLFLWDVRTGRSIRVASEVGYSCLTFTPDGKRLVVSTFDNSLLLCDPTSGKVLRRCKQENLAIENPEIRSMTVCESGKLVIIQYDEGVVNLALFVSRPAGVMAAWDLETGKCRWRRNVEEGETLSGLSPDGRIGIDWFMSLREVESGSLISRLKAGEKRTSTGTHSLFSADGSLIVITRFRERGLPHDGNHTDFEIWEYSTRRLLRRIPSESWNFAFAMAPDNRRLAVVSNDELWVWDLVRGKELLHHRAPADAAYWRGTRLRFAPDGKRLFMGTEEGCILLFAVPAVTPAAATVLSKAAVHKAWEALADPDPAKAYLAAADLADGPRQAVALLRERLAAVAPIPIALIRRLIEALDNDDFAAREAAKRKLAELGLQAWPALRAALKQRPSLEARRRVEHLLKTEYAPPSADALRRQRALRVLEWAGTAEARDVLRKLASGDQAHPLTQGAKAALHRLERTQP